MKIIQKGFNYAQDGEGNRLIYHLQGCNMRCPWCSNPEGIDPRGVLMVKEEELLDEVCPHGAITQKKLNREICEKCLLRECQNQHKNKGISLSYREMSVDEIVKEVVQARALFFDHGGITFSGGEATLQFDELKQALRRIKEAGIHTAIETNGTHPRLEELFPYVDELIMDFKQADDEQHIRYTGLSNERTKASIRKASVLHKNIHIRTPLIAEFNGDEKYISQFIDFFRTVDCTNIQFEFLKYHEYGKNKWKECGKEYTLKEGFVSDALLDAYEHQFRAHGFRVVRT